MEDKDGISGSAVIIFVFLLFGSLIFWASKAELDNVTRGEGKIISSVQNQKIQSTESGVIQKRFVTENSFVDEGQILFVLDPVDTSSELNQLTKRLETLEIREQRLQSEIQGKVFDPKNSSEVSDITFLNTERSLFVLRQSELAGKLSILKDKKNTTKNNSSVSIFLPVENIFNVKISLPDHFLLDEKDVSELTQK